MKKTAKMFWQNLGFAVVVTPFMVWGIVSLAKCMEIREDSKRLLASQPRIVTCKTSFCGDSITLKVLTHPMISKLENGEKVQISRTLWFPSTVYEPTKEMFTDKSVDHSLNDIDIGKAYNAKEGVYPQELAPGVGYRYVFVKLAIVVNDPKTEN